MSSIVAVGAALTNLIHVVKRVKCSIKCYWYDFWPSQGPFFCPKSKWCIEISLFQAYWLCLVKTSHPCPKSRAGCGLGSRPLWWFQHGFRALWQRLAWCLVQGMIWHTVLTGAQAWSFSVPESQNCGLDSPSDSYDCSPLPERGFDAWPVGWIFGCLVHWVPIQNWAGSEFCNKF